MALGQKAQTAVLGEDRVFQLNAIKSILEVVERRPELLTGLRLPEVFVGASASGLEGPAAVLGHALKGLGALDAPPKPAAAAP
jgi:hypothetical protein